MGSFPVPESERQLKITRMIEAHGDQLLRLCYLLIGDMSLAEDAVQETFLRAYRGLSSFRGDCSEKTWLTAIAANTCKNIRRSPWQRNVTNAVSLDDLPEPAVSCEPQDDSVLRDVMALPLKYRTVILMHYYQTLTVDEIAHALSLTKSAVTMRLHRARQKLKPRLERWMLL